MLEGGVSFAFAIPVFDGADDVGFIGGAELELDGVAAGAVFILEEHIEPAGAAVGALAVFDDEGAEVQEGGVFGDDLLQPGFVVMRVLLEGEGGERGVAGHVRI